MIIRRFPPKLEKWDDYLPHLREVEVKLRLCLIEA